MRRGLVVGKFMPLHRGHQLLIETALANVDELTVVVYDSYVDEISDRLMPAPKRAKWVTDLYPQVHNIVIMEDLDLPVNDFHDRDDPKYAQDYADQLAFLGPFTHIFSSEDYGEPFAKALGAQHVTVDAARDLMPISGTEFRSDMYKYRAYVDPLVYRSLIQKVVFVGTESTGKSTLTSALMKEFNTMGTIEYGRTLWEEHVANGTTPTFHDFWKIAETQYAQEQAAALHSNKYLFCDTSAFITMLWSEMYYGSVDSRLIDLVERTKDEYIWVLCDNDFGWVDDGTRELKDGKAAEFQNKILIGLDYLNPKHKFQVHGSIDRRIKDVKDGIDKIMESMVY